MTILQNLKSLSQKKGTTTFEMVRTHGSWEATVERAVALVEATVIMEVVAVDISNYLIKQFQQEARKLITPKWAKQGTSH